MIALGIDPGTATLGFGVVSLEANRLRLVDAGVVRTQASETDAQRLAELEGALYRLVAEHRPDRMAVERLFFQRNVQTAMAVGQARAVALLVAAHHRLPVDEPTPNEVKQADKTQVATMVQRLLSVTLSGAADDATDALAAAIGCLYRAAAATSVSSPIRAVR